MQTVRAEFVVLSTSWVRTSRVLSNPFLSFLFRFKQHPFTTRLGTFLLHMHQSLDSPSSTIHRPLLLLTRIVAASGRVGCSCRSSVCTPAIPCHPPGSPCAAFSPNITSQTTTRAHCTHPTLVSFWSSSRFPCHCTTSRPSFTGTGTRGRLTAACQQSSQQHGGPVMALV
jgi:hypothetical protein